MSAYRSARGSAHAMPSRLFQHADIPKLRPPRYR
jgi:hypothetical protein